MIRLIQSLSVLALIGTCLVVRQCARQWHQGIGSGAAILLEASAVQTFAECPARRPQTKERISPLVAEAEALARYLNPPQPPRPPVPAKKQARREPVPAIRPARATARFTVRGTSYNESRPETSMALIAESGAEAARWVREGERIGHFTIHEIKPGAVVCLAGADRLEMALQRDPEPTPAISNDCRLAASPSSSPTAAAAAVTAVPSACPTGPLRRPSRRNRRTVGSDRTMALD